VVVEVPRELRPFLGRRFVRSLRTRDLREARRLRHAVVAELQARIEAERKKRNGEVAEPGTIERAMLWRRDVLEARAAGKEELEFTLTDLAEEEARELEPKMGQEAAGTYWSIATGRGTPLSLHTQAWLHESSLAVKTKAQRQAAVRALLAWAGGEVLVEEFGRKQAGAFITKHLLPAGKAPATVNSTVSALSAYWRWLIKRGHAEANPLEGAKPVPRLRPGRG